MALDPAHLPDDAVPEEETPKQRRRPATEDAKEVQDEAELLNRQVNGNGIAGDEPTVKIVNLFRFHPFVSLFVHIANIRYARRKSQRSRVDQLVTESQRFYKFCIVSDFILTVILTLLLVAAVVLGIYKTLFSPITWPPA
ncbi:hypothetical protein GCM10009720_09150 [Yaniella flava]|uniref:Uncharacterized protein n=1 Tax=Yaniella flava TaxID=287930 RepID=A0ABN2U8J0_9MICC